MTDQQRADRIQELYNRISFLEDSKMMSNRAMVSQMHKEIKQLQKTK